MNTTLYKVKKVYKYRYAIGIISLVGVYFISKLFSPEKRKTTNPLSSDKSQEIADSLLGAMDQSGTDEQIITDNLKGLDLDSFNQVSNSFGQHRWVSFFGGHKSNMIWDSNLTLMQWFDKELTNQDKAEIQAKLTFKLF
jgi:hypothetical protein